MKAGKGGKHNTRVGKWYKPDDEKTHFSRKGRAPKPTALKKNIQPGQVLILLAGRFKGKRVVFLKQLKSGLLLVTGPYKVNGVPLKRVNQSFVLPTSTTVALGNVNTTEVEDCLFKKPHVRVSKNADTFYSEGQVKFNQLVNRRTKKE